MPNEMEQIANAENSMWVFGYGSLIWRPNFVYKERVVGYVDGFKRRFWQGSKYHRGSNERPGRVVTLVKNSKSRVWGAAYKIEGNENIAKAIGHLTTREVSLGGYETQVLKIHAANEKFDKNNEILALVYYASPGNPCYAGSASYDDISTDIFLSSGVSGSNVEYLFRLADFMRNEAAAEKDTHLYCIDILVRLKLGLCTKNIVSWLELNSCNKFMTKLRELSLENSENLVTA